MRMCPPCGLWSGSARREELGEARSVEAGQTEHVFEGTAATGQTGPAGPGAVAGGTRNACFAGPSGGRCCNGACTLRPRAVARVVRVSAPFVHRLRVRYGECDPQGVVFNAHYLSYFDIALTELWREVAGGYTAMMEDGIDLVVAEVTARFLASAGFDDELDVEISVVHLGTTSMTSALRVLRDGVTVTEGEMRHVFVDVESRAKRSIPEAVRSGLERRLLV